MSEFRRRIMMAAGGAPVEPAPEGVVWYKRLIFDANTTLDTGIAVNGVTFEWEVEWTRTVDQNTTDVCEKKNFGSTRDVRVSISRYYSAVPWGYLLYGALSLSQLAAAATLNTPSTFILSREAGGAEYTLTSGGVSCSQGGQRDTANTLFFLAGAKELRKSIIRKNGVEVQHLRPCTYNGVAGMWDTVNDVFIGNASGSGQFTVAN